MKYIIIGAGGTGGIPQTDSRAFRIPPLINGKMSNIKLEKEEYPVTGTIDFRS